MLLGRFHMHKIFENHSSYKVNGYIYSHLLSKCWSGLWDLNYLYVGILIGIFNYRINLLPTYILIYENVGYTSERIWSHNSRLCSPANSNSVICHISSIKLNLQWLLTVTWNYFSSYFIDKKVPYIFTVLLIESTCKSRTKSAQNWKKHKCLK